VDGAVGSLEILPEIVDALKKDPKGKKMTILFDSGIRTGPDVFKAIALGADAVLIGRLYVWGMSHEGEFGCRHVLKSLLADLDITCTVAGYPVLRDVGRSALKYNPHDIPPPKGEFAKL